MQQVSPRSDRLSDQVETIVKRIIKEPVKEAVREALAEEARASRDSSASGAAEDTSGSRMRRIVPIVGALVAASYVAYRWRSSSRDEPSIASESTASGGGPGRQAMSGSHGGTTVITDDEAEDGETWDEDTGEGAESTRGGPQVESTGGDDE